MIRISTRSLWVSLVRTFWKYLGYTVTATHLDGTQFVHYCRDWEDGLDWARCYSQEYTVTVSQALNNQVTVRMS